MSRERTREYIRDSWKNAVRKKDCNRKFLMPYDYVPPCVDGDLIDLYYWDTYFTNLGLYADDLDEYARGNIENLKFCLRKFGCVPNMCRGNGADYASQPPLLFWMIDDYYERTQDRAFLEDGYAALETEYGFWMRERISPNGLNQYGTNAKTTELIEGFLEYLANRLSLDVSSWSEEEKFEFCRHRNAEGESGEDHTHRFRGRAYFVNPVDLNSYLYAFERTMQKFAALLGREGQVWNERAKTRLALIKKYCFDEQTGMYFDYDYEQEERTGVYCAACYLPFVFGITDDRKAVERLNEKLVCEHGVLSCEELPTNGETFQWGYPNAWAPHQYFAYLANERAGNSERARTIAEKWLDTLGAEFERSGKLFEKYDAVKGGAATVNEYGLPEMLGWTAGVFNAFYEKLK